MRETEAAPAGGDDLSLGTRAARFVAVEVVPEAVGGRRLAPVMHGGAIEVRLRGGRSLVDEPGFDAQDLRAGLTFGVGSGSVKGLPSLRALDPSQATRIWLAVVATDMRCGFDRLAERVRAVLGQDPLSDALFIFRSRRGDRLKVLVWDRADLFFGTSAWSPGCSNCRAWKQQRARWSCGPASWR